MSVMRALKHAGIKTAEGNTYLRPYFHIFYKKEWEVRLLFFEKMRQLLLWLLVICVFAACPLQAYAQPETELQAPSAILIEASTGKTIWERNATERRSPASITKIMTLLLIFENLEEGRISLQDQVVTSAYAQSMGGSQVFLAEGEIQTVETLIKCIAVASGNDASVAAAEYIAGSEAAFVEQMNEKASELGMADTHFEDCCGLTDSDQHYTTARDVSIMSRELTTRYPGVFDYTQIWMEDITHVTAQGSSQFTLSSTNKLLKQYEWATGLKTGSTSKAKYCLSASASRDGIDLIAVVMGAPDAKARFEDARMLLEYGFRVSRLYRDENTEQLPRLPVEGGVTDEISISYEGTFSYLDTEGRELDGISKTLRLPEQVKAPVRQGEAVGEAVYMLGEEQLGSVRLLAGESVQKAVYKDYLKKIFSAFLI